MTTTLKPEIFYKIRRKSDGLFSKGGTTPTFTKVGKVWRRKGDLSSHLTLVVDSGRNKAAYKDCEIVEYHMLEAEVQDVAEVIVATARRRHRVEQKRKQRIAQNQREERRREYERLKKEFG